MEARLMAGDARRVVILNPHSGSGSHAEQIRSLAEEFGYDVEETEDAGDAVALTKAAISDGATVIGAAGGDGTLNEVLQGVDALDAFEEVTVGVIPVGTGNDFAENVGISDAREAFRALETGERRRIDVGTANGRVFLNSCIAGLTAEASRDTTVEMKNRYGTLAYVMTTLQLLPSYEPLQLNVSADATTAGDDSWQGEAILVLVGNGRRFPIRGRPQAHMEDGAFDVAIVEDVPSIELMSDRVLEKLFGRASTNVTRLTSPSLSITVEADEPATFSLDGEMLSTTSLSLSVRRQVLQLPVGETYESDPS